ncbi:hypothetical protein [Xylanimonas ulmi]|uniref:hypothetical protein n=1 Tax=Xylanimonas ulmi TaxID=228973 RepID=UPI00102AB952|nr:hypothetical protein [Xylanibacterium ulmi]
MTDNAKLSFYLRHRAQIEEWAALRTEANREFDAALRAAIDDAFSDMAISHELRTDWRRTHLFLPVSAEYARVGAGLSWLATEGLEVGVVIAITALDGKKDARRGHVQEVTTPLRLRHGMKPGDNEWIWKALSLLPAGSEDLDGFARARVAETIAIAEELRQALLAPRG